MGRNYLQSVNCSSAIALPIRFGMSELESDEALSMGEIRRAGGGRKSAFESIEGLDEAFLRVIAQHTAGSPMDETVKWTNLTRAGNSPALASRRD